MSATLHLAGKSLPQVDIDVTWHFSDRVVAKEMHVPAGVIVGKEMHPYSHLSHLQAGRAILHQGESQIELQAPAWVKVDAGVLHAVEALTDVIWVCIHASE